MSLDATQTGSTLPPWSLTAAGRNSDPTPARAERPADNDFGTDEGYMFGADGLTFTDVLDIINPLQHLPVVSTLYRAITGDAISPGSRMLGGAIFGGPTGFAAAVVNNAMVEHTGQDVGETVLAALLPEDAEPVTDPPVMLAAGETDADAQAGLPAPPTALTAPSDVQTAERPPFGALAQSPLVAPETTQPLIDRRPRQRPFAAGPAAPLVVPMSDPVPPTPRPVQTAALPQPKPEPVEVAPAPPRPAPVPIASPSAKANSARPSNAGHLTPTPLDPSLIPQAMLSALEKYEQMKRGS